MLVRLIGWSSLDRPRARTFTATLISLPLPHFFSWTAVFLSLLSLRPPLLVSLFFSRSSHLTHLTHKYRTKQLSSASFRSASTCFCSALATRTWQPSSICPSSPLASSSITRCGANHYLRLRCYCFQICPCPHGRVFCELAFRYMQSFHVSIYRLNEMSRGLTD